MAQMRAPRTLVELFRELASLARSPGLLVWALFVLLNPVYLFSSGLPQPGDMLIVALVPFSLAGWNGRLSPILARPLRVLAVFTLCLLAVPRLGEWPVVALAAGSAVALAFNFLAARVLVFTAPR